MTDDPMPTTADEGREAARTFLAAIDGRAASAVFVPEAELLNQIAAAETGSETAEHLSACLAVQRALVASGGQAAFDLMSEREHLTAEIALIRTAADVTTADEGGRAFRQVLTERADELAERLDSLDDWS